jgi:hypothetical protein
VSCIYNQELAAAGNAILQLLTYCYRAAASLMLLLLQLVSRQQTHSAVR